MSKIFINLLGEDINTKINSYLRAYNGKNGYFDCNPSLIIIDEEIVFNKFINYYLKRNGTTSSIISILKDDTLIDYKRIKKMSYLNKSNLFKLPIPDDFICIAIEFVLIERDYDIGQMFRSYTFEERIDMIEENRKITTNLVNEYILQLVI
jgi:hypothetical protein